MTFAVKIKATKKTGSHPLETAEEARKGRIQPRAGGAILTDVSINDGNNNKVALPAWFGQIFNAINSGTIATIIGGGTDLKFNATGDVFVNYVFNVQLDNTTGPFTGLYNLYFKWNWAGKDKFLGSVQLDNFNNDAWTIAITGLASMWGDDLKIYMGVDNAQDTFYWWGADFQLLVPTTNFPSVVQIVPPPLIGQGGGPPPNFPPPTPPPIGAIPPGILVGPAIQASSVPPSIAGNQLIRFTFGSATAPPASAAFPEFTTTFPSPPIVFSNIFTDGVSPTTPPHTTTTQCIALGNVYGPPIGPALPPVVPGGARPFMTEAATHEADESESEDTNHEEHDQDQRDDEAEHEPSYEPHQSSRSSKPKRGRTPRKK